MKKNKSFMLVILCFFLFSCDESESINQDASLNYQKNYLESNYIEYQDALNVSNKLVDESIIFLSNLTYTNQSENQLIDDFYSSNDVLSNISNIMGLEVEIVPKNYNQFEVNISDVENSEFLNNKQKDYAINLLKAVENNNFSELVQIKKSFKEDVIAYPELRIFNSGIALIEATQNYMNTNGAFGKNDCLHAAMVGGVMAGVYGMISGAITGGLSGLVIGGALTGGILAVPAGGAGAIAGATIEGFFGFVGGAILGYIGCLIFG